MTGELPVNPRTKLGILPCAPPEGFPQTAEQGVQEFGDELRRYTAHRPHQTGSGIDVEFNSVTFDLDHVSALNLDLDSLPTILKGEEADFVDRHAWAPRLFSRRAKQLRSRDMNFGTRCSLFAQPHPDAGFARRPLSGHGNQRCIVEAVPTDVPALHGDHLRKLDGRYADQPACRTRRGHSRNPCSARRVPPDGSGHIDIVFDQHWEHLGKTQNLRELLRRDPLEGRPPKLNQRRSQRRHGADGPPPPGARRLPVRRKRCASGSFARVMP